MKLEEFKMYIYEKFAKSGKLTVVGKGCIEIPMGGYEPKKVEIKFIDEPCSIPCETLDDKLFYECIRKKHRTFLFIEWDVSNTRIVEWFFK
jgi:hypothetical protein